MDEPTEPRPPIRYSLREVVALTLVCAVILAMARVVRPPFQIVLPVPLCGISILLFVARRTVLRGLAIGAWISFVVLLPFLWQASSFDRMALLVVATGCSWGAFFGGCARAAVTGYGALSVVLLWSAFWLTGLLVMAAD